MAGITKVFENGVVANEEVYLAAEEATVHAIVGENGAGKTTLMNILYGRYRPDAGRIRIRGADVAFHSPADAIRAGIGMVTQHSTLVPALTLLDNVLLGHELQRLGMLDRSRMLARLREIEAALGIRLEWNLPARQATVATRQKAEIVRALSREAKVLILDEPTAALAPGEAAQLFEMLHALTRTGRTVLFITHRLKEVMEHAQRVTVLRGGHSVAEMPVAETTATELAALMVGPSKRAYLAGESVETGALEYRVEQRSVGEDPWKVYSKAGHAGPPLPVLEVRNVSALGRSAGSSLRAVSLEVHAGEILGIAGVDGSGQRELCEVIVGLLPPTEGRVVLNGHDVTLMDTAGRFRRGLAYCPEDRQTEGLVLPFTVEENLLLGHHWQPEHGGGFRLEPRRIRETARLAIAAHHVEPPSPTIPAAALSGGNQQKLLVARALLGKPSLLVAMQPTRGLDLQATRRLFEIIAAARAHGLGVLLVSLDLEELLDVSDRSAVMYEGRVAGVLERPSFDRNVIGQMMTTGSMA